MSSLIGTLRAIVRDELARLRQTELGVVTQVHAKDSDDSKNNHQVNLKLRSSGLELERVPVAVGRLGLSALPNEGDLMVVAFVNGDLNAPVALGCLYDHEHHPPQAALHEVVYQPPDDAESGVRRLHVELQSGSSVTLDDDKLEIAMGETTVVIAQDGDVTIQVKGNVQVKTDGNMEFEAGGDIKLTASGNLLLKGASAALEGQSETKVKGPQLTIAGNTNFSPA